MSSLERVLDSFRDAGLNVKQQGREWLCQGPGHSDKDLSVRISHTGERTLIYSYAGDNIEEMVATLGLSMSDLFDDPEGVTYTYPDGREVKRSPTKAFVQHGNTKGDKLYGSEALEADRPVYLCEGEQDVDSLRYLGAQAVTNAGGAAKLHLFDLRPLNGKDVVVVRDRDDAGDKHAKQAIELLTEGASSVAVMLPRVGKDATDHVAAGYDLEQLVPDRSYDTLIFTTNLRYELDRTTGKSVETARSHIYKYLDATAPQDNSGSIVKFDQMYAEWLDYMADDTNDVIPTPWPELDDALAGGIHKGQSALLAGRPSDGKSIGLINFVAGAAEQGYKGILYSVEMGRVEIASRIVASGATSSYGDITRKTLKDGALQGIEDYAKLHRDMPLYVCDDSNVTLSQIRSTARQLAAQEGLDFLAVDYLQLLSGEASAKKVNANVLVGEISWGLKLLAKELGIAVISACQLNRDSTKEGRPPTTADLRESGRLEQDCDVCLLIHHELHDGQKTGMVDFIVAKNRSGPQTVVTLPWQPDIARIG